MQSETRNCQSCKQSFTIEPDDFGFYEKKQVPVPLLCSLCRQQLRTSFRNFKTLYKRPSSKSGRMIVSMYDEKVPFPVYDIPEWWSDDWDPMNYGIDIDWQKPFSKQLLELFNSVPHVSLFNTKTENCEYSNFAITSKNCYLIFGCIDNEDCDYGHIVWNSRDCLDNLYIFKCEACYECIDCLGCNKLSYSQECENCVESMGLFDCRGCFNCVGCVGLVGKSYCIFNEQVSKEDYARFLEENPLHERETVEEIMRKRDEMRKRMPQRAFFGFRNNNVSGNHIYNAHNVHLSFDVKSGENSKFCFTVRKAVDSYDVSFTADLSECYNVLTNGNSNRVMSSQVVIDSHDVYYSDNCHNCDNIFGCYGLRKKSYCILNKQYSKEEYETLFSRLIEHMKGQGEWGEFFPKEISPFGYNESIACEYMPLGRGEALGKGFKWQDNIPSTSGQETVDFRNFSMKPEEYAERLKNEVFACDECRKNYKLISREIGFYRRNSLAIPRKCFNCRHKARMQKRNERKLWKGICAKCGEGISTSYTPEDQNIYQIYCERCYQKEIY